MESFENNACTYRFAGHSVAIRTVYAYVHDLCRAYRTEAPPEFVIQTSMADIALEWERLVERASERADQPISAPHLEALAVYRKLSEKLIDLNILLFHGSAVAVDGAGYLFAAQSGTGKSTHARLWRELLGERAEMVNDDKPLLSVDTEGITVWGTPWDGKHHLSHNICTRLKAICLLERGDVNRIESVSAREAWPALYRQIYKPTDPAKLQHTLALADTLAHRTHLYRLHCTPDIEAAHMAYEAMSRGAFL